jgi:hypothetical protein
LPYASTYGITGLITGGFISVEDLMNDANGILAEMSPGSATTDPNQAIDSALTQVFQGLNANGDFVSQELAWA